MVISRTASRPFRRRREYVFSGSEKSKSGHFANRNTSVSYFGRKFFRFRNVGKIVILRMVSHPFRGRREYWFSGSETSLCERELGFFEFREEIFQVPICRKIVILRTVSWPFRRRQEYAFSGSEISINGHFANGNPAVWMIGKKRFSDPETSEKLVISRTVRRPFLRRRECDSSGSGTS